jgi:hypothetical protein
VTAVSYWSKLLNEDNACPNTVVMECQEFSVLLPEEELVPFIVENVLREQENKDKDLFQQLESLFSDENARKYLLRMKTEESAEKLSGRGTGTRRGAQT